MSIVDAEAVRQLAGLAVGAGEEDAQEVQDDRGDEDVGGPSDGSGGSGDPAFTSVERSSDRRGRPRSCAGPARGTYGPW